MEARRLDTLTCRELEAVAALISLSGLPMDGFRDQHGIVQQQAIKNIQEEENLRQSVSDIQETTLRHFSIKRSISIKVRRRMSCRPRRLVDDINKYQANY